MFTLKQSTRAAFAVATLATCLAAMTDLAHGQRRQRAARRPVNQVDPAVLDNATTFTRSVETVKVTGSQRCLPPQVAGDDDFKGNGPHVVIRVQFLVHANAVYRRVYMMARETGSIGGLIHDGDTKAEGWSGMQRVWTPPSGTTIVKLLGVSDKEYMVNETLHGHGKHYRRTKVGRMTIVGDTDGTDVGPRGWRTYVDVNYNYDLPVLVQKYSNPNFVRIQFPRTVTYHPPHTDGDRDFHGHGPRVNVEVYVTYTRRQVNFEISMHARETKSDWTTYAGRHSQVMYTAPAGKFIKALQGKQKWYRLISYVDNDHDIDSFNDPELGPIKIEGDSYQHDYPYIVFLNIQRSMLVELGDE